MTVAWYGGASRRVETADGSGHWYRGGDGQVPIRWAFVHDRDGTHRDESFYTTDPAVDVRRIIEIYTGRWSIETTFQETRSELHIQTTRGWSKPTVMRAVPCLFGLYSVVAMLYAAPPRGRRVGGVAWPGKAVVPFSDALTAVRRRTWAEGVFAHAPDGPLWLHWIAMDGPLGYEKGEDLNDRPLEGCRCEPPPWTTCRGSAA